MPRSSTLRSVHRSLFWLALAPSVPACVIVHDFGQTDDDSGFTNSSEGDASAGEESESGESLGATSTSGGTAGEGGSSGGGGGGGESSSGGGPLSHAIHIQPLWDANCSQAACHDAEAPQAGLDLVSMDVYERLCTQFHGFSGMPYIDCMGLEPDDSYVYRKLEGSHLDGDISGASGAPMPLGGMLSEEDRQLVEDWILGGALP